MNKTILIVDDDEVLIGIYKEILELQNYDVETALNGEEGVEKFKQTKPSLVVMDGDMPTLDGYDAFKQIIEIDKNANVVIITGISEFEPKSQEAIKHGLIKVMSKPILVDELLNLAKRYTGIKLGKKFEGMEDQMLELTLNTDKFIKKLNKKLTG
jgi:DNA-binding NtrC family response regulator